MLFCKYPTNCDIRYITWECKHIKFVFKWLAREDKLKYVTSKSPCYVLLMIENKLKNKPKNNTSNSLVEVDILGWRMKIIHRLGTHL